MRTLWVGVVFLLVAVTAGFADEPRRFVQDRFAIGFWVDPPADEKMDQRYGELAEANFTVVIGGFGARTPEQVRRQLELCEKYDLKAIVGRPGLTSSDLPTGPACWGYKIKDEPNVADFPGLQTIVSELRQARPGHLAFINLYPNYATAKQLGTDSYEEHVRRFVEEVDVDILCMDHYPAMRPDADTREAYCRNLEVMREASLVRGIPFWNFFNVMPFGNHFDPTEGQIRWQIYTSLAYGAKGVLYFCYWTPRGREFPKGGAIISAEGRRTRHYDEARRINGALKHLGSMLMKLTSTEVYRVRQNDDPSVILSDAPLHIATPGEYLIGVFKHADGRRAVLLNNYHFAYTAWPTVEFDADAKVVVEICPNTGREIPVLDDSPAMEGRQISLDAGAGRLFLLPVK